MTRADQFVCATHIDDSYLAQLIQDNVEEIGEDEQPCSFCEGSAGASIESISDVIRDTIERYYMTANDAGVPWDEGAFVFPVLDTSDVLSDLVGLDWPVHQAVLELLEDEAWVPVHDPAPSPSQRLRKGWNRFRDHVEHTSRFMLAPTEDVSEYEPEPDYTPASLLAEMGRTIEALRLVSLVANNTAIYRARTFDDAIPFECAHELAAPPPLLALSSAHGRGWVVGRECGS